MAETSGQDGNAYSTYSTRKPYKHMWQAERCGPLENERLPDAQNSTGRKQAYGTTESQHLPLSWKRKDGTKGAVVSPEGKATSHRGVFLGLDTMDFARLNSGIAWEWCLLFFLPFIMGMSITIILSCPIFVFTSNLVSSFIYKQRGILPQNEAKETSQM